MQHDFWHERWINGQIGFHRQEVHHYLKQYSGDFFLPHSTILVPLCGKSLDMIYLAKQGHTVIGVELSPLAVEQFFQEQKLSKIPGPVANSWQAKELPITLYCGDFFKMPAQLTASINAIYDRAAIIALPIAMRAQYAQVLKSLAHKKTMHYLLIAIEFNNSEIGPPFSVPQSEIKTLYGQQFTITFKTSTPYATSLPHHQAMGLHSFDEYCLELKLLS